MTPNRSPILPIAIVAAFLLAVVLRETGPHDWGAWLYQGLSYSLAVAWPLLAIMAWVLARRYRTSSFTYVAVGLTGRATGVVIGGILSWRWAPVLEQGFTSTSDLWVMIAAQTNKSLSDLILWMGLLAAVLAWGRNNGRLPGGAVRILMAAAGINAGMILVAVTIAWLRLWRGQSVFSSQPMVAGAWPGLLVLAALAIIALFWVGLVAATLVARDRGSARALNWLVLAVCALGAVELLAAAGIFVQGWTGLAIHAAVVCGLALCLRCLSGLDRPEHTT